MPSHLFQAPHTITALQPEEPPHLPQPPPMTGTDPQSHVSAKHLQSISLRQTASQPPRQTEGPNTFVSHPHPTHTRSILPLSFLPGIQVGLLDLLSVFVHFKSQLMRFSQW